jgi:hypothetical protein
MHVYSFLRSRRSGGALGTVLRYRPEAAAKCYPPSRVHLEVLIVRPVTS